MQRFSEEVVSAACYLWLLRKLSVHLLMHKKTRLEVFVKELTKLLLGGGFEAFGND